MRTRVRIVARRTNRTLDKNLNQINIRIGRIGIGIGISNNAPGILGIGKMFKSGKGSVGGVFKAFGTSALRAGFLALNIGAFIVKGIFSIGKFVIKGVVGFAKGIANLSLKIVSGIMKKIATPVLKGLFFAMMTPAGAFAIGFISHYLYDKSKRFFQRVKKTITENKFYKDFKEHFLKSKGDIVKSFKNMNIKSIKDTVSKMAELAKSGKLFEYISDIAQLFTPENIGKQLTGAVLSYGAYKLGEKALTKSLKYIWKNKRVVARAASSAFKYGTRLIGNALSSPIAPIAFMVGGFALLIKEANDIMPLFAKK
jgi:hypothetical protein